MSPASFEKLCEQYFNLLITEGFEPLATEEFMHGMVLQKRYCRGDLALKISAESEGSVDVLIDMQGRYLSIYKIIKPKLTSKKEQRNIKTEQKKFLKRGGISNFEILFDNSSTHLRKYFDEILRLKNIACD